ncbi:MAG: PD40 domain-containing protein [Planctomycetes bacterium]|nr:PD40 domain-containing protein [Planctomycetota bacterium]MBI3843474.1 PD40 domain-containing protein [Planctomycetota bacterium]
MCFTRVICVVATLTLVDWAFAQQATTRVSVSASELQGDAFSTAPSISANGRFVTFHSAAQNLVPGDTNGFMDVFLRDRLTGQTERVSVDSTGGQGNGDSFFASTSDDGRYVTFSSDASNLVSGDGNGVVDVFVHDRASGETSCVSVGVNGADADGRSDLAAISADGRFVAFTSAATNLVVGDTDGFADVFVRDLDADETSRVSIGRFGAQPDRFGVANFLAISADGRFVAFQHLAGNLVAGDTNGVNDVFLYDRAILATTRVSVSSTGAQANGTSGNDRLSVSANGRFVAFASSATNLTAADSNELADVFLHDMATGETSLVSTTPSGDTCDGVSVAPSLSRDGRYVAFLSTATNLVPGDTNGLQDVFVRDLRAGTTERVSIDSAGTEANGDSYFPALSGDGRQVAFISYATNLVMNDTNGSMDVFVHDRMSCAQGTVNAGQGPVVNVLVVNGNPRFVPVDTASPIEVSLAAAPTGPTPARYVLWIWRGAPMDPVDFVARGQSLGCMIAPTPIQLGAGPQPAACLRGGVPPAASRGIIDVVGPGPAPWTLRRSNAGRARMFTIQGAIEDAGAANSIGFSVTNAVVVAIQ